MERQAAEQHQNKLFAITLPPKDTASLALRAKTN